MKLSVILIFSFCIWSGATSAAQTVTLSFKSKPLIVVLKEIKKQSGYDLFYNRTMFENARPVTIDVTNSPVEKALDICFRDQPLTYEIIQGTIVVKDKPPAVAPAQIQATVPGDLPPPLMLRGRVTDEKGAPLAGASIVIKGTNIGTRTDGNGDFTLRVSPGDILQISYVGYEKKEITPGNETTISIALQPASAGGEGVVVTALGIQRSSRSLTYDVQKLDSGDYTVQKDANFMADLAGKVAGATISASTSGEGGSVRVILRGIKSITQNNNALYVIDGMPMQSLQSTQPTNLYSGGDGGEGISSLNPDDIASISVLSGPGAAALYGSSGANGVILITTKKGRAAKTSLNYFSNASFSDPLILPKLQNTYAPDTLPQASGPSTPLPYRSWTGPKLSQPSGYKASQFFNTGATYTNSVNLTSGNDRSQNYFSAASVNSTGIIPNNKYDRYNFTDRVTSTLVPDKLFLDVSSMYAIEERQNIPAQGQYNNPLVAVYLFPPGYYGKYDIKDYARFNPTRNFDTQYWPFDPLSYYIQNPYWIAYREINTTQRNRFIGSAVLRYNLARGFTLTGRAKYDNANDNGESKEYASTLATFSGGEDGRYTVNTANTRQFYGDLLLNYKARFNDLHLDVTLGSSLEDDRYRSLSDGGTLAVIANFFSLANISQNNIVYSSAPQEVAENQAVFGTAQLSWKDRLFLDVTGRNDWNSALAYTTGKSDFYPSVGLSGLLDRMLTLPDAISLAKLRMSYSEVGNSPPQYLSNPGYAVSNGTVQAITAMPFETLKPERTKSMEGGLDLSLFKDALTLSATYYSSRTINQVFSVAVPAGVGFSSYYINAGQINNEGAQATLGYTLHFGRFTWNPNLVFSRNKSIVAKVLKNYVDPYSGEIENEDSLVVAGTSGYAQRLVQGQQTSDIYAYGFVKNANGTVVTNTQGLPQVSQYYSRVGTADPKANLGLNNKFSFDNFNFSFLVTARIGGVVISNTEELLDFYGESRRSATARDNGGVEFQGKTVNPEAFYNAIGSTGGGGGGALAYYSYSATNVRLGEVVFGYTIPAKAFNNKVRSLNVSFVGRNLWMIYNKAPFDPEATASTSTFYQGFDYFNQPSMRNLGFRVTVGL
jgi:TonB-linked SusC/RagA family outer membrane protein